MGMNFGLDLDFSDAISASKKEKFYLSCVQSSRIMPLNTL